jgi:hypothetical protein
MKSARITEIPMSRDTLFRKTGKIVAATLILGWLSVPFLGAQERDAYDRWNNRWRVSFANSTGTPSLGAVFQITLRHNRLVITRSNTDGKQMSWSCALNGTACRNDPLDGSQPTTSFVHVSGDRLLITTRGALRTGKAIEMRRTLYLNQRGELIIDTSSSEGDRFRGRSVYRAYKKVPAGAGR